MHTISCTAVSAFAYSALQSNLEALLLSGAMDLINDDDVITNSSRTYSMHLAHHQNMKQLSLK